MGGSLSLRSALHCCELAFGKIYVTRIRLWIAILSWAIAAEIVAKLIACPISRMLLATGDCSPYSRSRFW